MLKGLFGGKDKDKGKAPTASKPAVPAPVKLRRTNINRRFTIISQIPQGTMSRVYKAVDNEAGRTVCLKVQDLEKTVAASARASGADRPTEGEIASKIVHPNVVRIFDYGLTPRREYYLAMEFVEGASVLSLLAARSLSESRTIDVLVQAAEALAEVHAKGYIHHDFGPKNLLVNRDNQLKLIDFGLAVPNTPAFRRPGNRTGTLNYMAPELLRREPTDERIDVFSYGVTAFEALTGKHPYDVTNNSMAMMLQRINTDPMDPLKANPKLSPPLCEILRKAIARRKEDRYASMTDLLTDLKPFQPERD